MLSQTVEEKDDDVLQRALAAFVTVVLTIASAAAASAGEETATEGGVWSLPRFVLQASDGRTVTDEDFRGRQLLVFFGYTQCPDICPTGLQVISEAMDLLGAKAATVQPLFITVDPMRDDAASLAGYVTHFHKQLIGLSGTPSMIERVAKGFRARYERVPEPGGDPERYSIDHTAAIFHMGPDGAYLGRFPPGTTPAAIAEELTKALSLTN